MGDRSSSCLAVTLSRMLIRTRHAHEARGLDLLMNQLKGLDRYGNQVSARCGPVTRREARGLPVVKAGGIDIRRDPVLALEDRELDPLGYRDLLGEE